MSTPADIEIIDHESWFWNNVRSSEPLDLSGLTMARDDLLVMFIGVATQTLDRAVRPATGSGWSQVGPSLRGDDVIDTNMTAWTYRVGLTPPSSINITSANPTSGSSSSTAVTIVVLRNTDLTTPIDVTPTGQAGENNANVSFLSITPASTNAFLLAAGLAGYNATTWPGTVALTPQNMTQVTTVNGFVGQGQVCLMTVARKDDWVSGAFTPSQFRFSHNGTNQTSTATSSSAWAGMTIAFRPALISEDERLGTAFLDVSVSLSGVASSSPGPEITGSASLFAGTQSFSSAGKARAAASGSVTGSVTLTATGRVEDVVSSIGAASVAAGIAAGGISASGRARVKATGVTTLGVTLEAEAVVGLAGAIGVSDETLSVSVSLNGQGSVIFLDIAGNSSDLLVGVSSFEGLVRSLNGGRLEAGISLSLESSARVLAKGGMPSAYEVTVSVFGGEGRQITPLAVLQEAFEGRWRERSETGLFQSRREDAQWTLRKDMGVWV